MCVSLDIVQFNYECSICLRLLKNLNTVPIPATLTDGACVKSNPTQNPHITHSEFKGELCRRAKTRKKSFTLRNKISFQENFA